ncbi:MAG: hypothetical protein QOF66_4102 [Mycobacterium sp.]|jgi:hypothetical protein|nr:hypothetical protein [Mycobacterium sp.]
MRCGSHGQHRWVTMNTPNGGFVVEPRWQGAALLRPGVLAFTGSIGTTDRHAHHALQIMTAATPLTVVDDAGSRHCGTKVTVPADAAHRIETGSDRGSVVFLEPESAPGRAANQRSARSGWAAAPVLGHTYQRPLATVVADLIEQLTPTSGAAELPQRHPAVNAALNRLPDLVEAGAVRGTQVAAQVGVSASRLTHLLTEQVGIPPRRTPPVLPTART